MIEPPIPNNEIDRIASLKNLNILDTNPEERFDRITQIAKNIFSVPIVLVSLVDTNRQWFKSCVGLFVSEVPRSISFCGHAILSDEPFIINDALNDPRFNDNPLVKGDPFIRFYAGIPLKASNGQRMGSFCVIDKKSRSFSTEEINILKGLAHWVELELNLGELSVRTKELEVMTQRFKLATDSAKMGVWEWNIITNELVWDAHMYRLYGIKESDFSGAYWAWEEGVHPEDKQRAAQDLQDGVTGKNEFDTEFRVLWPDKTIRYIKAHGVVLKDQKGVPVKMIGVNWDITNKKSDEEKIKKLAIDLKQLSITDPLTGLLNRRGFEEKVSDRLKIAKRNKQHVYVFFIDIDNMKVINDTFGHHEGDAALLEVAAILKESFRDVDLITRLGGDEFSVLMTMMNLGDENIVLERIEGILIERNKSRQTVQRTLSLSIGGASCNLDQPFDLEVLLGQADSIMYKKKENKKG